MYTTIYDPNDRTNLCLLVGPDTVEEKDKLDSFASKTGFCHSDADPVAAIIPVATLLPQVDAAEMQDVLIVSLADYALQKVLR
jgi:hypothetical protein